MLSAGRSDSIGAVPGQVIDARCSSTRADGPDSTAAVELPQVQLLFCCGRPCDHAACSSSPVARFSRDSSDRVLDIPVVLTVQFLNKVVAVVVYDWCPWSDSAEFVHRQGRRHPWFRTSAVPQIQSSTELNDVFEAVLAYFSDSPARG